MIQKKRYFNNRYKENKHIKEESNRHSKQNNFKRDAKVTGMLTTDKERYKENKHTLLLDYQRDRD